MDKDIIYQITLVHIFLYNVWVCKIASLQINCFLQYDMTLFLVNLNCNIIVYILVHYLVS